MVLWSRFSHAVRRSFWKGIATLLPALLTIVVIVYGYQFLDRHVAQYINRGVVYIHQSISGWDADTVSSLYERAPLRWVGIVAAIIGICIFGYFLAGFIGSRLWRGAERLMRSVPVVKQIYPPAKQITEFVFSEKKLEFNRVVAVEYPRKGIYSLAFVTGRSFKVLQKRTGVEYTTVFIPNSPWPVTGFTVSVPKNEIVDLPMSVDEALRYVISGGVIGPRESPDALVSSEPLAEPRRPRSGSERPDRQANAAQETEQKA